MEQKYIAVSADLLKKCLYAFNQIPNKSMGDFYTYELASMLHNVIKDEAEDSKDRAKLILENAGHFGVTAWHKADVRHTANQRGYALTEEQLTEVVEIINAEHNAEVGFNWENFWFHLDEYCEEHGIERGDPIETDLED